MVVSYDLLIFVIVVSHSVHNVVFPSPGGVVNVGYHQSAARNILVVALLLPVLQYVILVLVAVVVDNIELSAIGDRLQFLHFGVLGKLYWLLPSGHPALVARVGRGRVAVVVACS